MRMFWPILTAPGICFVRCTQALIDNEPANVATISSSAIPRPDKNSSDLDSSVESYGSAVDTSASGGQRMESIGPIVDEIGHGDNEQEQRFAPMDLVSSLPASVIRAKNFVMTRLHQDRVRIDNERLNDDYDLVEKEAIEDWIASVFETDETEKSYARNKIINVLTKNKPPEEVVKTLAAIRSMDEYPRDVAMLYRALAHHYTKTPDVLPKAWVKLKFKPEDIFRLLDLRQDEGDVLKTAADAAIQWIKYTELFKKENKHYAMTAEVEAKLLFDGRKKDHVDALIEKVIRAGGEKEFAKMLREVQRDVAKETNMHRKTTGRRAERR
uniref:RxLR effector candidate protein n=1 Tax=Peronospora matthiolae TaxID=2874970 RepID=A0AAV1VIS9_9STRA